MYISHAHAQCTVCRSPLTVHEQAVGAVCGETACQLERLKRRLAAEAAERREVAAAERREMEARSRDYLRRVAETCDDPLVETLPLAVLPSNPVPLANLPEKRRRRFRDQLMQIVSKAAARRCSSKFEGKMSLPDEALRRTADKNLSPLTLPSPPLSRCAGGGEGTFESAARLKSADGGDDEQLALWAACCALCRGDCCRQGGDDAFLDVETILRYMRGRPRRRPRQVLADYLSHVGHKTYQGACVYHGSRGCTLPRAMRAEICGAYYCRALAEFQGEVERGGFDRGFAVVWQDGEIVRAGSTDDACHDRSSPQQRTFCGIMGATGGHTRRW